MNEILYKKECYDIQGAVFEVNREMGCGFLESVYQECLEKEFVIRKVPFQSQRNIQIQYKNQILEQFYKPDLICYDKIILEIKAVKQIHPIHRAQLFNYLHATKCRLGLLINFGHFPKTEIERIVLPESLHVRVGSYGSW